jgi:hypothetical protein
MNAPIIGQLSLSISFSFFYFISGFSFLYTNIMFYQIYFVGFYRKDPLQGDFPEVIEEYLQHGLMKCIAFNRRGTLLAGT